MVSSNQPLEARVRLTRRYVRSTDMVRDLSDPMALDGYVVTGTVRDAARRVVAGLDPASGQRAFRVTGPYGSGKSSFGLFLARLLGGDAAANRIAEASLSLADVPSYTSIVMTGRRSSFSDDLLSAVADAGAKHDAHRIVQLVEEIRREGRRDFVRSLDALDALANEIKDRTGHGTLLLIDEMGRYLEFAAAHPRLEDPSVFQQLAERAGGRGRSPLAVVGFLHHRFSDYVAGMGTWIENEWARSAERYEEIAFSESTEQTLFLLAHALTPHPVHERDVTNASKGLFKEAGKRGLFTTTASELATLSRTLYPLHPATVTLLSAVSRRFGQNERSVFGFLQSLEPHGFRRFAVDSDYGPSTWYRPAELFDYLRAQGELRLRSSDRERRWQLAVDAVASAEDMAPADLKTLKTVALLVVLDPVVGLRTDADTLAWCSGMAIAEAEDALGRLVDRRLLYRRPGRDDHRLWSESSVDLEKWLDDARTAVPPVQRLDPSVVEVGPARPLVAHRHYHRTGTLRTFSLSGIATGGTCDGRVVLVPLHPDQDPDEVMATTLAASMEADSMTLHCVHAIKADDLKWARELAMWRWIEQNCQELRVDDLARSEVATRISGAEAAVSRALSPPTSGGSDTSARWVHEGTSVDLPDRGALSRYLSDVCDRVFASAPILRNELINRGRLSTAVASARMRLLELMATRADQEFLGLKGAPPERTIYLAVLQASGLHRSNSDGTFGFAPPEEDPLNWRPAWERVRSLVSQEGLVRFDELVEELGKAPIGLRAGPALILVAAFMLANRRNVALMERGSFQPEVTGAHFMRLAKSPAKFALRFLGEDGTRRSVLEALASDLSIFSENSRPEATLRDVVETIYAWWREVPAYSKTTRTIDALSEDVRTVLRKAKEPVELIFVDLPVACGALDEDGTIDVPVFVERLDSALLQMTEAEPLLRGLAVAALTDAFGVRTMNDLHDQILADYAPHRLELREFRLRQFVERMLAPEGERRWLDGVTGLLVGKRLDGWDDASLDRFTFEARAIADRLARWLITIRRATAAASDIRTVHVVSTGGEEKVLVVRPASKSETALRARIIDLLGEHADAAAVLGRMLADMVPSAEHDEEHAR